MPELVPSVNPGRVLVFTAAQDYDAAISDAPDFPWSHHIIEYDCAAAAAKAGVTQDNTEESLEGIPLDHGASPPGRTGP